jgi:hypothetical protein
MDRYQSERIGGFNRDAEFAIGKVESGMQDSGGSTGNARQT